MTPAYSCTKCNGTNVSLLLPAYLLPNSGFILAESPPDVSSLEAIESWCEDCKQTRDIRRASDGEVIFGSIVDHGHPRADLSEFDTTSSASRQHFIDTGYYLRKGVTK